MQFRNSVLNISKRNKYYLTIHTIINKTRLAINNFPYIYINNNSSSIFDINKKINLSLKNNTNKLDRSIIPKISIIIYCNEIKFLKETLISIIEQKNFSSFEIIIIYDSIEKMYFNANFKFNNIFIFNNLNQKGLIYSFVIGVLASKGKYILNFQTGFTLAKKDTLLKLYELANNKNIDVLEFNLLINKDNYINDGSLKLYKCHHYNSSLNTNIIKYNKNYKEIDQDKELLINKLIRNDIYKDIIQKYQLFKYNKIIFNNYDDILIFLLNKRKIVFKRVNIFGVIKNINYINASKLNTLANNEKQKILDAIFYINFLFDNSANDNKEKKIIYNEYVNKLGLIYNKYILKSNQSIILFKKFIECKYINEIEKNELSFFYNSLFN